MPAAGWKFISETKKHTQDGPDLVQLMKTVKSLEGSRKKITALDIGCGDGIISYEILKHKKAHHVTALDVDKEAAETAKVNLNSAIEQKQACVFKSSAQSFFKKSINTDSFDCVVINPPFFKKGSGLENKNKQDQWARHEDKLTLPIWTRGVKKILRTGGELYCVFPTERLAELLTELSKCNVEAKEIWWLKQDKRKRRFFLRAIKGARPGIIVHFDFPLKA